MRPSAPTNQHEIYRDFDTNSCFHDTISPPLCQHADPNPFGAITMLPEANPHTSLHRTITFSAFGGSRVTAVIFKCSSFRPFFASTRFFRFWCLTSLDLRWYGGICRFDMITVLPEAKLSTY